MIVFKEHHQSAGPDASKHLNPLAVNSKDSADLSLLVELRHNEGVLTAAAALVARIISIYERNGAGSVVATAVARVQADGRYPSTVNVKQKMEDMLGEVSILGENIAHAGRLEDRRANYLKGQRGGANLFLAKQRLLWINERLRTAGDAEAEVLAFEARELDIWIREPWRHPNELVDVSPYFAALQADPGAFDPPLDDGESGAAAGAAEAMQDADW